MRILFDQSVPVPLRQYLVGHTVRTAAEEGWDRLANGDLLSVAEKAGFDLLLTTDRNMQYQQNLTGHKIAVIILSLQQWPKLRLHAQLVDEAIHAAIPGSFSEVEIPFE